MALVEFGDGGSSRRLEELEAELYRRYLCWRPRPELATDGLPARELLARLTRANTGRGTWQPGWRIRSADGEILQVEQDGVLFRVSRDRVRHRSETPEVGDPCRVLVPEERQIGPSGFYLVLGDADEAAAGEYPSVVRLYWNLLPAAAPTWVSALTAALNRKSVPFSLKVLSDPRRYRRADAGILYLEPDHFASAWPEVCAVYRRVAHRVRPETPLLTARLAPGLGVAEGSADGDSFGQHRCRLIADALVTAWNARGTSRSDRQTAVADAFLAAGLDPARPHLAAGSETVYDAVPDTIPELYLGPPPGRPRGSAATTQPGCKETASRLGDALCREAYWHQDRCNWVGRVDDRSAAGRRLASVAASLGPDLYAGSAGVGLFLARLFAGSGDRRHRDTAIAALRRSLRATRTSDSRPSIAFATGSLGIVWSARQVAGLTATEELETGAGELLTGLLTDLPELLRRRNTPPILDLLNGSAGAIQGLLDLYRQTADGRLLEAAIGLGSEMRRAAVREPSGTIWPNETMAGFAAEKPPLTGLSHGASGLGLALLELFAVTGDEGFLEDGRAAFDYEARLFDAGSENWPDYREAQDDEPPRFMTAWCHGAPGIALARLRAAALDPAGAVVHEKLVRAAVATTEHALSAGIEAGDADTSLCHGLSGLIEVLLTASAELAEPRLEHAAREAAQELCAAHGPSEVWPSGVASRGPNPSLFLGRAGIGYTLVRLVGEDQVPSVLLPGMSARSARRRG